MSDGMKRRDFLKTVGASSAAVATVGCTTDNVERLIPYVVPSEEIIPGIPTWYTTTCRECPAGCGLHVETHEGRATKVEGNPGHPISHGNTCARGQASVQGLYHPDRYRGPFRFEVGEVRNEMTWGAAEREIAEQILGLQRAGRANRIVFLTGDYTGTMDRLVTDWVTAAGARRVVYEPFAEQPRFLDFQDSDLLISFGADFLETWGSPVDYTWQFTQMHSYTMGRKGKFIWIAPHRPMTGLNADQWIAPKPGSEALIANLLLGVGDVNTVARESQVPAETLSQLVRDYAAAAGRVAVLGPGSGYSGRDTTALRTAVDRLNNVVTGVRGANRAGGTAEVLQLIDQMARGEVDMILVSDDINPAYTLPGAANFAAAMARVPVRVSFATFPDETSLLCSMVLPSHHFLEKWDDYVPQEGVRLLVQPTMRPVFNTRHIGDVLLGTGILLGAREISPGIRANTFFDYLRANWASLAGVPLGDQFRDYWQEVVTRGGVWPALETRQGIPAGDGLEGASAATLARPRPAFATTPTPSFAPVAFPEDMEAARMHLVVYPSYRFFDGRTANRPWLLELPDPVTKISWDSWVEIHPRAAAAMGIKQGQVLRVRSPYGSVDAPAYIYPGVRPDTVAIQMGLGHDAFGRYTENRGVNPNVLLGPDVDRASGDLARYGIQVVVNPAPKVDPRPQGLFEGGVRVQYEREFAQAISFARLATLEAGTPPTTPGEARRIEELKGDGGFAPAETPTDPSEYPPPGTHYGQYFEYLTRWAMVIDLDRCIGCGACVTACYAENNIPVVGPDQVRKGREMTWLRIERYFGVTGEEQEAYQDGSTDDVRFLPMLCQHCGNAPCEPVCPVYAAYHTPDGLNGQIYNRCVGTRYCLNNCPYKVRYFNWFTWQFDTPLNWQLNPDVTVREKGVMEKCTFCVQRINEADREAAAQNRPTRDGDVVPACVQTCPAEVFVFGNIQDPASKVAQAARSNRSYRVLEAQNTKPGVVYLQKVTMGEPHYSHHASELYHNLGEIGAEDHGPAGADGPGQPHAAPAGAGAH